MTNDELEIRALVTEWFSASKAGETERVLELMTDDVVFLRPGRPPLIGKEAFAAAALPSSTGEPPEIDAHAEIKEVKVFGDWAYMWSQLTVTISPVGSTPLVRRGPVLSILSKAGGKWRIFRDANMLTSVSSGFE